VKQKSLILGLILLFVFSLGIINSAGAEVEVNIDQGNEVVKILNDIHIPADRTVTGEVVAILGDIKIDGQVTGDVVAILGDIEVNNTVTGEVVSLLGSIEQGPQGEITGGITELGGSQMMGEIGFGLPFIGLFGWGFKLVRMIVVFGLAVLVLALIPEQERAMAVSFRRNNLRKLISGFLALILWPVVTLVSVISIVGIPLAPLIILAFFVVKFIGYVAVALFVGDRIKQVGNLNANLFLQLLMGVVILSLLGSIPVVGGISYLVVAIFSLGVIIDTKFGTGDAWFDNGNFHELPEPADSNSELIEKSEEENTD